MYEDITKDDIAKDILSRYKGDAQINEGSYTSDMIYPTAYKIWTTLQELNKVIPIAFVDETSGEYLEKRCAEFGITRKPGQKATTILTITGTDGTEVEKGKLFTTDDGLEFETDDYVTIVNGVATVNATAVDIGTKYNVLENTITSQVSSSQGITTVTNTAATGGTEAESDESLYARLKAHMQNPSTSGNVAHYKEWALSVDGIGDVKVFPTWNGPGTVKVVVISDERKPVDLAVLNNCYNYIEENRPIGASVTVESAKGIKMNISASIIIDSTTTINTVISNFKEELELYFKSIAFVKNTVVYNRISHMLLDIPGVEDYAYLRLNNRLKNIELQEDEVPVLGTLEIILYGDNIYIPNDEREVLQ